MKKVTTQTVKKEVEREFKKAQSLAEKEISKVKKEFTKALKQAEQYVKKNPEKATAIAAGVGATIGAGVTALVAKYLKKK
jgi:ElaB/YqjD/DUF883 family membrane-anchored ribosome-binding protein